MPVAGALTPYLSPAALEPSPDGTRLYVACTTANLVQTVDVGRRSVIASTAVPAPPTGLAVARDGSRVYVTCAGPTSQIAVIDPAAGSILKSWPTGHTAMGPVLSPDNRSLYVCLRFENVVARLDTDTGKVLWQTPVAREPVAAALTPDGRWLLVANHLHNGPANADTVAAVVTVLDAATGTVAKELQLPNGSGVLNEIRVSPDGRYAAVSHLLGRFPLPTTQLDRGWMNTNALTLIDLESMTLLNTVLLDNIDRGAANPWGLAWTADSQTLAVTHAGTHELSLITVPAVRARLDQLAAGTNAPATTPAAYASASRVPDDVPNDLAFLVGMRRRIAFPETDRGPRAVAIIGQTAFVAHYFTDTLSTVSLDAEKPRPESFRLGPAVPLTPERQGELAFHDAGICFQGWQSCASCHPGDGRVDALNWDLLNDGIGNPKNNKSMLLTHRTPPSMSSGVRETGEMAVRAGIRHILFTVQPESVAESIDAYLKALRPVPSPHLVKGQLSPAAQRGHKIFNDTQVGCATCHPPTLFTDLNHYDVGTASALDQGVREFDTPTLVEVWRTAPYLHDGSAVTLKELFTQRNAGDRHGATSHLTPQQLDDLVAYLLSL